jgi:hypothetical protein
MYTTLPVYMVQLVVYKIQDYSFPEYNIQWGTIIIQLLLIIIARLLVGQRDGSGCQRCGILRSANRCRHCILGLLYSSYLKLESQNLARNPCPLIAVDCTVYSVH